MKDVRQYEAKLRALQDSAELKQALKKEQAEIDQQRALVSALSSKLLQAAEAQTDAQIALCNEIADEMAALRSRAERALKNSSNDPTGLLYARSFNEVWVQGIEAGQAELEVNRRFARAEFYFQMMNRITPDEPWPALLLAETSALRGDRKQALKELRQAVKRGLKRPESIDEDVNLQALRRDPEFQQIVAELKARQ